MEQIKGPDKEKKVKIRCCVCGSEYALYKTEMDYHPARIILGPSGPEYIAGFGITCPECDSLITYKGDK